MAVAAVDEVVRVRNWPITVNYSSYSTVISQFLALTASSTTATAHSRRCIKKL